VRRARAQPDTHAELQRGGLLHVDLGRQQHVGLGHAEVADGHVAEVLEQLDAGRQAVFHRGHAVPSARWERISRAAEIVRGPEQWQRRLDRHAAIVERA